MGNSGNGRPETVHHRKRQTEKVAVRHNWYGGHFGSTGGDYDAFYENMR